MEKLDYNQNGNTITIGGQNVTSNRKPTRQTETGSHIIQKCINLWTDEMWTAEEGAVSVTTIVPTAANWTKRSVQLEGEKIMSESHCVVYCIGLVQSWGNWHGNTVNYSDMGHSTYCADQHGHL